MFNRKPSFFERLTGSSALRDDEVLNTETELPAAPEPEGELAIDIYQTSADIVIKAMIAGVKPEDLTISITRDMVTVRGHREVSREISEENYIQRELYWGSFSRAIVLPTEIDVEEAEAVEKNGLLTLRLPKLDKNKTQNVKVRSL
jgi:HSP20 family protein